MPRKEDLILQAIKDLGLNVTAANVRLDHTNDRLSSMDKTLAKQEANIEIHVRRSDLNEEQVKINKREVDARIEALQNDFKPVARHVVLMEGMLKGVGSLAFIVSIGAGIIKIVEFLQR